MVEKVAVVGDRDDRPRVFRKVMLQPFHGFGIEVVGRLVEEKDVGLLEKQAAESHAALLASRENLDLRVAGRAPKGIHGELQAGIEIPRIYRVEALLDLSLPLEEGAHLVLAERARKLLVDALELAEEIDHLLGPLLDYLPHGPRGVEPRLLLEIADRVAGARDGFAVYLLVNTCDDLEEGALSRAVETDDAYFCTVEE